MREGMRAGHVTLESHLAALNDTSLALFSSSSSSVQTSLWPNHIT